MTHVTLTNEKLVVQLDGATGRWLDIVLLQPQPVRLLHTPGRIADVQINGEWWFGEGPCSADSAIVDPNGLGAEIVCSARGVALRHRIDLDPVEAHIRLRLTVQNGSSRRLKLTALAHRLPGFCVGRPADCTLQVPGDIIPPDTPYAGRARIPLDRGHCEPLPSYPAGWVEQTPCQSPGLITIENRARPTTASTWLHSERCQTFPTLDGRGEYVDAAHLQQLCAWLEPGDSISGDDYHLLATNAALDEHYARFRALAYDGRTAVLKQPDWLRDVRLFQIIPVPIRPWADRLGELRRAGFNLIYMTPVWEHLAGGYAIKDHYRIDPAVATEEELKRFIAAAHDHGFRVIFDFIPQGCGDASDFPQKHPDWLVRDELGRAFGSHGWGPKPGQPPIGHTYSVDWGNPDYRRWVIDWALWNMRTLDIDGWRTDAMHWKEANFGPRNPRPAWHTTYGGIRLAEELADALQHPAEHGLKQNEFILLSEVWGPIFQRSHHATYQSGWLLTTLNRGWCEGKPVFTGSQWTRWLAIQKLTRPQPYVPASFTSNHDTQHIAELACGSVVGEALNFMHVLSDGIPFVSWGDVQSGRLPLFARLIALRNKVRGCRCRYDAVRHDAPHLFTALWCSREGGAFLAAANLSYEAVRTELAFEASLGLAPREISLPPGGYDLVDVGRRES